MNFKELLKSKGLSGYSFAKKSDIHQPAVSKFVTGKRDPLNMSVYSGKRAAAVLGMSLDEFYESLDKGSKLK